MALHLRPLHDTFGAEVSGVDFSRPVDEATLARIEDAWARQAAHPHHKLVVAP